MTPEDRIALASKGGLVAALNAARLLPEGTPPPRWRSRQQVVAFLEEQANLVRTGQLDRQVAAEVRAHAEVALRAYELAALDRLDEFEKILVGKARRIQ